MNRHVDRETDRPKTVCPVTQLGEVKFENQITSSYFIGFSLLDISGSSFKCSVNLTCLFLCQNTLLAVYVID